MRINTRNIVVALSVLLIVALGGIAFATRASDGSADASALATTDTTTDLPADTTSVDPTTTEAPAPSTETTPAPATTTTIDEAALNEYLAAVAETEAVTTTTTAAPVPETTTTVAPPPTAPPLPSAPSCSNFASQDEADAWMAANGGSHDTSNIDTNGDGVACTLSFAPPPAPAPAPEAPGATGYGSGACGGSLPPCYVMMRESGGDITAQNPSSTASGKWQFLDSTWAGYGGYAKARYAPESVQDDRARQLWAGGSGCSHWSAC